MRYASDHQCIICPIKRYSDCHRDYVTRLIGAAPGVHPAKARLNCGRRENTAASSAPDRRAKEEQSSRFPQGEVDPEVFLISLSRCRHFLLQTHPLCLTI